MRSPDTLVRTLYTRWARDGAPPTYHIAVKRGSTYVMELLTNCTREELLSYRHQGFTDWDYVNTLVRMELERRGPPKVASLCYDVKVGWVPCSEPTIET